MKCSPEVQAASARRSHTSHGRFRPSEDDGRQLRAGTNPFHPVFGRRRWCSRSLLPVGKGVGSAAMLAAAAGAPGARGDGPGTSLNAVLAGKLLLTLLGAAFSCLLGHRLVSSMGRPCSAPRPWGGWGPSALQPQRHPKMGAPWQRTDTRKRLFPRREGPRHSPAASTSTPRTSLAKKDKNKGGFVLSCRR